MRVRILGCSGGIGGAHQRTTSLLVDSDILIDAGTGVGDLSEAELAGIDHIFVTHSHLDHIACLPLIVDTVGDVRATPLLIHATRPTRNILKRHIFNWAIWPDFSEIPDADRPMLAFRSLTVGDAVDVGQGRRIHVLPADHTVPAVAYGLEGPRGTLVFSGDTGHCDALWQAVNRLPNVRYVIIETAFSNRDRRLATVSKHLCPSMLHEELGKLEVDAEVFITHLKPGRGDETMREIQTLFGMRAPRMLKQDQVFDW